jgi:mannose-1-phosphate guanylyltransferase
MINIILCGGSGTRLWPISRKQLPKQFVKFFQDKSLFQLTVQRNRSMCKSLFIVSNTEQYALTMDQLEQMGESTASSLFEPVGRNTAPAIALACFALKPDAVVLVTPSDHLIKDEVAYQAVVERANVLALDGHMVTFGIKPTFAETGFGYIEADGESVRAFHEKPDFKTASSYLEDGNYYWNSGMFCFKAGVFLEELKQYAQDIYEGAKRAYEAADQGRETIIKHEDMVAIPKDSIDYAVMERSTKVKVVASDIGWSDVGSFDALYEEMEKDANGNTLNPQHVNIDSKNNLIYGNERKIATVDIEDTLVVDTGDALLISKRGSSQKVRRVVEEIKKDTQLDSVHTINYRPWGNYIVLEDRPGYKIKKIEVKPGKRLSLQKHFHRSEHWIVVSGTATVTVGEETKLLRPNESTYIKMGEPHRLANEGKIPIVVIEAQVGEYTEEDDIVRIDDDFKRDRNG